MPAGADAWGEFPELLRTATGLEIHRVWGPVTSERRFPGGGGLIAGGPRVGDRVQQPIDGFLRALFLTGKAVARHMGRERPGVVRVVDIRPHAVIDAPAAGSYTKDLFEQSAAAAGQSVQEFLEAGGRCRGRF